MRVRDSINVGTNGSLVALYSAVKGGTLNLSATASFSEASSITFSNILLGMAGQGDLRLTNLT